MARYQRWRNPTILTSTFFNIPLTSLYFRHIVLFPLASKAFTSSKISLQHSLLPLVTPFTIVVPGLPPSHQVFRLTPLMKVIHSFLICITRNSFLLYADSIICFCLNCLRILPVFYALVDIYNIAYPWAKKELLKKVSFYTTNLQIRELREGGCGLSKTLESHVKVVECR